MKVDEFDVLILAGGHSSRMGLPKAWLPFGDVSALEILIRSFLKAGARRIIIVINSNYFKAKEKKIMSQFGSSVEVISNELPDRGRSYSIQLGVKKLIDSSFIFIHNVDCPLVKAGTIKKIFLERNMNGVSMPKHNGNVGHPILISKKYIPNLLEIDAHSTLRDVLSEMPTTYVDVKDPQVLKNINTRVEYERMRCEFDQ